MSPAAAESADPRSAHGGGMWSKLVPELLMLLWVLWFLLGPFGLFDIGFEQLFVAMLADGAMLMASCTLIDLASRLAKSPPWWIAPLLVVGLFMFFPEAWDFLQVAWDLGWWVLIPFAWSIIERIREIWTLPKASRIEKIRRRTLTFDRLYVALVVGGLLMLVTLIGIVAFDMALEQFFGMEGLPIAMVAFYLVNCINVVRVHGARFGRKPRSLVPFIDQGQAESLDPL